MPVKPTAKSTAKTAKPAAKATVKAQTKPVAKAKPAVKATAAKTAPVKATAKTPVKKPAVKADVKPAKVAAKTPLQKAALKPAAKTTPVKKAVVKPAAKPAVKKPAVKKPVSEKAAAKVVKPAKSIDPIEQIARTVAQTLDTNKAEQIVTIPLAGRSSLADWMVIASGKSARQVGALANYVQRVLTEAGCKRVRTEGMPQGDWVVIDSGDVVIHIFRPEVRDYYQLERLWAEDEVPPSQTRTLR